MLANNIPKLGLVFFVLVALSGVSLYYAKTASAPEPLQNFPSISSTSTVASCKTGACTMGGTSTSTPGAGVTHPTTTLPAKTMKYVTTTLFWVGEPSDADNDYIPNDESAWQSYWQKDFGGVDTPDCRNGSNPCTFTPKQNPFYFALPYNDLDADGNQKAIQKLIPWYTSALAAANTSILKNRWIKVTYGAKTCYAQWEDVGPNEEDDFNYVFGDASPRNTFGEKAGLDLSPATWNCLGLHDNAKTYWAFLDEKDIPPGPWRDTETVSGVAW